MAHLLLSVHELAAKSRNPQRSTHQQEHDSLFRYPCTFWLC